MKTKRFWNYLATLILICSTLVGTSSASANSANKSVKSDAASFWTAKRINEAIAFDMIFENGSKVAKRVPVARESRRPGGGGSSSVIGTSWVNGGLPLNASGKVFFTFDGVGYYQCSGSLVNDGDPDYAIVLTAGHCMYEQNSFGGSYAITSLWIFIPSYDLEQVRISGCGAVTAKCWAASSLTAHENFRNESGFTSLATQYDWGFAKITETKSGLHPDELGAGANSFPIAFDTTLSATTPASSFGYPAAGKYKGNDLVYSRGPISFDANNSNATYALASDMTGGCSGGPWLSEMGGAPFYSGTLRSVNSYKYGTTKFIYGPKFSAETEATFNSAKSATS